MSVKHLAQKRHRLRKLRGETAYVDAAPIRDHLEVLYAAGWSLNSIAGVSGVPATTLSKIGTHQQGTVRPQTIARVLAVDPDALADRTNRDGREPFVSKVGCERRIQALMFLGWTHEAMRAHCGIRTAVVLHQQGRWITRSTHDAIASMYRDLCSKPGPSARTVARAKKAGYVGPLAWNNIDRDPEPYADLDGETCEDIDPVVVERLLLGDRVPSTRAEKVEAMRRWRARGGSEKAFCELHGWKPGRYVTREAGAA